MVLLFLTVIWAVYVAVWYRSRNDRRGNNSIHAFARHLSNLERTSPSHSGFASIAAPASGGNDVSGFSMGPVIVRRRNGISLDSARRRRRNVLVALASVAVGSLILIPFLGAAAVVLQLAADIAFVGYVVLLVRSHKLATERRAKVRYLPHVVTEAPMLLQRSAN